MSKFLTQLKQSASQVKETLAKMIAEDAKDAQDELVKSLKSEQRELERTIVKLDDIYPEQTTSTRPTKDDFDAKKWVADMQDAKVKLKLIKVKVETAEETYAEYFGEPVENPS